MSQKPSDYHVDHRVIVVEPTPAMQKVSAEIAVLQEALATLQAKYRELEETQQRLQLNRFKNAIRHDAKEAVYAEIERITTRALTGDSDPR